MAKDPIHDYIDDIKGFIHFKEEPVSSKMVAEESSELTSKMKQILIDWLIDVHQSFQLKEETLHLAILYLEEYQLLQPIRKEDYGLPVNTRKYILPRSKIMFKLPPSHILLLR